MSLVVAQDYDLRTDGVATFAVTDYLIPTLWEKLQLAGKTFFSSAFVAGEAKRYDSGEQREVSKSNQPSKAFQIKASSVGDAFNAEIALLDEVVWTGVLQRLIGRSVQCFAKEWWVHLPSRGRKYEWSQNWHRDPEGPNVFKCFLYMNDVDEDAGPFQYVVGSHRGRYPEVPQQGYPRVPVPDGTFGNDIATLVGGKGTLIIANTAGIHRGGRDSSKPRHAAMWAFMPV